MWGGLACLFGRGRREAATDRVARIWEAHDSVLSITCMPGRTNPSSFTKALGPALARGENSKLPYNTAESGWGPHNWSVLSPTAVHRDRELLHGTLDPSLGAYVGLDGGSMYLEAQHRAANGQPKVNEGHATGAC
jgi:hypothetical protein